MNIFYMMDGCILCAQVEQHLESHHIMYRKKDILQDANARGVLKQLTGEVHVPVLHTGNRVIIGREILPYLNKKAETVIHCE